MALADIQKRPPSVRSGVALKSKYAVQHRSDILMEEKFEWVKNIQNSLKKALTDLEASKTTEDVERNCALVQELKEKSENAVILLQVLHKVNTELTYARVNLENALDHGRGDVETIRKRVIWLEDRIGKLCGKVRLRGQSPQEQVRQSRPSVDRDRITSHFVADSDEEDSDIFLPSKLGASQKPAVQFGRSGSPADATAQGRASAASGSHKGRVLTPALKQAKKTSTSEGSSELGDMVGDLPEIQRESTRQDQFASPELTKTKKVKEENREDASPTKGTRNRRGEGRSALKWTSLEHNGPLFAPQYEPLPDNIHFYYDGEKMKLSLKTEEVATFYAKVLDHEVVTRDVFNKNFMTDWRELMTSEEKEKITDLKKCDFTEIATYLKQKLEDRRAMTDEEKKAIKMQKEETEKEFNFCKVDGRLMRVVGFVEPPGLFRGRGHHPRQGCVKKRIMPEDITINCSKDSVPEPPPGHRWKEVRHDNTVHWMASYHANVQNTTKYQFPLEISSKSEVELSLEAAIKHLELQEEEEPQIHGQVATTVEDDTEEETGASERIQEVDIISKLSEDFYKKIEDNKWTERKAALEELQLLTENPRLAGGDYSPIVAMLLKVIGKDPNDHLVAIGSWCLEGLATGLQKKFSPYANQSVVTILEKFSEKKPTVVNALRKAIDAVYLSTNLEAIIDDILAALQKKNASILAETLAFLALCFAKSTPKTLNDDLLKMTCESLLKFVNIPVAVVRKALYEALGTAMKVVGEEHMMTFLTGVDSGHLSKIQECCEKAVLLDNKGEPRGSVSESPVPSVESVDSDEESPDESDTETEDSEEEEDDLTESENSSVSSVKRVPGKPALKRPMEDKQEGHGQTFMTEVSAATPRSRVTIVTPTREDTRQAFLREVGEKEGEEVDLASDYWSSEHHRFEHSDFADMLCELDPLSYHQMGLAVPGSFLHKNEEPFQELPWRPHRKGSDIPDVHKVALNKLAAKVHAISDKIYEAAMLSVRASQKDDENQGARFLQSFDMTSRDGTSTASGTGKSTTGLPTTADPSRPQTMQTPILPKMEARRLGTSGSGRMVYYPKPIPPPEVLPLTRTSKDKQYPRVADSFSETDCNSRKPAERIVDQRNLHDDTKLTLFREKPKRRREGPSTTEKKFRLMLERERTASSGDSSQKMKSTFHAVTAVAKASLWSKMKPKNKGREYSGLKWERVKTIVHTHLMSKRAEERIDAAKNLGIMRCGDAMVFYALKSRLKSDEDQRVRYESAKALIRIGCWEEDVLQMVLKYLVIGNTEIRQDLIHTMIDGKNVQYVDKRTPIFPELVKVLSHFCRNPDPEDPNAFDAAVLLGKLCVADDNARSKLKRVLEQSEDTHLRAKALEVLVKQLNCTGVDVIRNIVELLRLSPVWKYRALAGDLLIVIGAKRVSSSPDVESIYELLERKLWDDPNKEVRVSAAKALTALGMFSRACDRIQKKLEDPEEDARSQAVISVGTLGMKNEKIIRMLLEMLELDSSDYVRLMIVRTFTTLNLTDKRVLRALRERDRLEGPLARESRKALRTLETLIQLGTPRPGSRKSTTPRSMYTSRSVTPKSLTSFATA